MKNAWLWRAFQGSSGDKPEANMGWREAIRYHLRRNSTWVNFRRLQREGWLKAIRRWQLWSEILNTPPIITDRVNQEEPVEVHLLCYKRDYLCAIWALKSFYHFAGVRYPLVIHLQGNVAGRVLDRLQTHFPMARIIPQPEADASVEKWLIKQRLFRLLAARRTSPLMLKLTDFPIMSQTAHLLTLDSDVVFFRCPKDLLIATREPLPMALFQRDLIDAYNISKARALTELGIDLAPQVNTGIMLSSRDSIELSRCEEYLAHPDVARPSTWIEQTLHALCASEQGKVAYLPDSYLISLKTEVQSEQLIARHYAGASRPLLTSEGIPGLIQVGFLEQLRAKLGRNLTTKLTKGHEVD